MTTNPARLPRRLRLDRLEDRAVPTAFQLGSTGFDAGWEVAYDGTGNLYAVGEFRGTVDFDPGPGTTNQTSAGPFTNSFLAKYSPTGSLLWAGSLTNASIQRTAVDAAGAVYTTGYLWSTTDFDLGPGVSDLTPTSAYTAFVAKYNPDGGLAWVRPFAGTSANVQVMGAAIGVDAAGNIYTTGRLSGGSADFDPGPGTFTLTNPTNGSNDYVCKLDPSGNFVWARQFVAESFPAGVWTFDLGVDAAQNLYLTGHFFGRVDFDPGPGTRFVQALDFSVGDAFVAKLTAAGDFAHVVHIGSAAGREDGFGIVVDSAGNAYVAGGLEGTTTVDATAGDTTLVSAGSSDAFVLKLNATGGVVWAGRFGGGSTDEAYGIAFDGADALYVTGQYLSTVDFDLGPGVHQLTYVGGFADAFVLNLQTDSTFVEVWGLGGTGSERAQRAAVSASGDLAVVGRFEGTVDFDPGPGVANLTSAGEYDAFVAFPTQPPSGQPVASNGTLTTPEDTAATGTLVATDPENDPLTYSLVSTANAHGTVTITNAATGAYSYTPAADYFGPASFTFKATAGGSNSNAATVSITVTPVNDAPAFTRGNDETADEDGGPQSVPAWATGIAAGPANEAGQGLTFQVTTDNDALFGVLPAIAPDGTLTYTPALNAFGSATVTVSLTDDGGTAGGGINASAPQTFTITVGPVNDAPAFTAGADQTVTESAGPQTVAGWATGLSVGPANESGQTLTFDATTDNDALFAVPPAVAPDGTLTYTPAPAAFGSATVTVTVSDDGGTASGGVDTSAPQTFTIILDPLNDAPILTGDVELTAIPRNHTTPPGDLIADFAGAGITDPDPTPLQGIAVVGGTGTAAQGTWEFSTNGGQDWSPFGTPSAGAARLLRDTDRVRFVPAAGFLGTVALTYRAWDRTSGTAGATADLTGGVGGTTAFSTATATGTLQVGITITPVKEDTKSPKGDKVSALLSTFVTDPDLKAKSGIAVVGVTNGSAGTWQYAVKGKPGWKPLTASPGQALLLRSTDKVRYLPAANAAGFGSLRFHAWDQTTGKAGTRLDLTAGKGGATAFSAARSIGFAEVPAVHDAPVLDIGGEPPLTRVAPTATDPAGDLVKDLIGPAATDAELDPIGMAVTAAAGKGTWQIKPDGTADWIALGTVSNKTPKFLNPLDRVRFVPTAGVLGSAKLKFKAWDGTLVSKASETGMLLVTIDPAPPANTAPALDTAPAPAFLPVLEDTKSPLGDITLALLGQAVTDPDPLALRGIAVTGVTGTANGTWQFSTTNGKTWKPVGIVSDSNALLLRDTDKLRFLPARDYSGTATVTYRAWDRTRGTAGARSDVRINGGTTPFSAESETASAAINAVNDAPVLNTKPTPQLTPVLPTETDPPGDLVSGLIGTNATDMEGDPIGIAVTTVSGPGTWQYRETGSADWSTISFVAPTFPKFLAPADRLRFVPTVGLSGSAKLSYQAWDGAMTSIATESVSLIVNGIDDKPVLNTAGSPMLTPVAVGATNPAGDLVSAILGSAASDADPGADLGIAVTGATTTAGTWEVMVNGTTWEALGPVSAKAPRRLKATDRIRFVPTAGFVGSVKLSFKAWDAGSANPNGPNALSAATETAVVVVNTAPVLQV